MALHVDGNVIISTSSEGAEVSKESIKKMREMMRIFPPACNDEPETIMLVSNDARSGSSLDGLLEEYKSRVANNIGTQASNYKMLALVVSAQTDEDKYTNHLALKCFIKSNNLDKNEVCQRYLVEFEEFHCNIDSGGTKRWRDDMDRLHRETKGADGLTLPAIIFNDEKMGWHIHGQLHRSEKTMVNGRLETLPAVISGNERKWCQNGKFYRDDKDEFGNLLPTEIRDNNQYWQHNLSLHRAELGKNVADATTFGKALPAVIKENGEKQWFYFGDEMSQNKLTKKLGGEDPLDALMKRYKKNIKQQVGNVADNHMLFGLIMKAQNADGNLLKNHYHVLLKNNAVSNDPLWEKYLEKYEDQHYKFERGVMKWFNNIGQLSRITKGVDGLTLPAVINLKDNTKTWYLDGKIHRTDKLDSLTLPAVTSDAGLKQWRVNGVPCRTDLDEFGNTLPTDVYANGQSYWLNNNFHFCREELGKNPADANFGMALPAYISSDGQMKWYHNDMLIAQETLTEKLGGTRTLDCSAYKSAKITLKNGTVVDLTDLTSIQLVR